MKLKGIDYSSEAQRKKATKHGGSDSPEYSAWKAMRQRCLNPKNPRYDSYGGRGITVCDEWRHFIGFLQDMGQRPSPSHSLERRDNDGNYTKENCMWALPKVQSRNRRVTRYATGIPLAELAQKHGLPQNTLSWRLERWTLKRALEAPVRPKRG
jgi:hypothetical protein